MTLSAFAISSKGSRAQGTHQPASPDHTQMNSLFAGPGRTSIGIKGVTYRIFCKTQNKLNFGHFQTPKFAYCLRFIVPQLFRQLRSNILMKNLAWHSLCQFSYQQPQSVPTMHQSAVPTGILKSNVSQTQKMSKSSQHLLIGSVPWVCTPFVSP